MKEQWTGERGLKLVPEMELEWLMLLEIANDGDDDLPKRFGKLMDEDSMWDEIVVPELEQVFFDQRLAVATAVMKAKREGEPINIDRENVEIWYGALNQARLALEAKYKFGSKKKLRPEDLKARAAFYRDRLYHAIQSSLLEILLDG